MDVICVIADVVASRASRNRYALQCALNKAFRSLNARHKDLLSPLAGVLLSLNESNLVVRCAIEKLVFRPPTGGDTPAVIGQAEYDRGRLIGLLERLLIFFLVLQQQYTALGFVLTAKSIARFKELEDRDFAEYFLIGTLLSIVIAGSIALVTRALLS